MKKITLPLSEVLSLYIEITGINPLDGTTLNDENLLKENLSISTKFKLHKLVTSLNSEIEIFNKNRDELIKKYGTSSDNINYTIINPIEFDKEIEELVQLNIDIEYHGLSVSEFEHITTSNVQPVLYKLFE